MVSRRGDTRGDVRDRRVSRDRLARVLWDDIKFIPDSADNSAADDRDKEKEKDKNGTLSSDFASPEWVRRTVCCACWEIDHADEETNSNGSSSPNPSLTESPSSKLHNLKVVLAVCTTARPTSPSPSPLLPLPSLLNIFIRFFIH